MSREGGLGREEGRPGVLLDQDGTLCEEVGYLNHLSRLSLLPGIPRAIRLLNEAGLPVLVVTNQGGVGSGYFPEGLIHAVREEIFCRLRAEGAHLDGYYYCPHHPQGLVPEFARSCHCRKPAPGLAEQAAREHGLDLLRSYVVGDRRTDLEMARRIGAKGILVLTGYGRGEWEWHGKGGALSLDFLAEDLLAAARWILKDVSQDGR